MAGNVIERLIIEIGGDARKFKQELNSLKKANKGGEESFKKLALVGKAGFLAVAAAAVAVGVAATKSFISFEKGVTNVAKTTNLAGKDLENFKKEIMDLSEEIPATTDQLLSIATAAGQLGIKGTENLTKFTEVIAKLGATTDLEGEAAAIGIARILNLTNEGINTVDQFGSTIVDLGNNFATSESQILEVATEVAKATVNFKLASPEILGMSAAMSSLGIEAEAGSTVVGKAFMSIDSAIRSQGGPAFEKLMELTGMTGEELTKTFQTDATAVFQSFINGLGEAGKSGKSMSDELHQLGLSGIRVEKILPTLAERSDILADALKMAGKAAKDNSALNKEAATAFETSASKLQVAQNKINNILIELGTEVAPIVVGALTDISDAVRENKTLLEFLAGSIKVILKSIIFSFGVINDNLNNIKFNIDLVRSIWNKSIRDMVNSQIALSDAEKDFQQLLKNRGITEEELHDKVKKLREQNADENVKLNQDIEDKILTLRKAYFEYHLINAKQYKDQAAAIRQQAADEEQKELEDSANKKAALDKKYADAKIANIKAENQKKAEINAAADESVRQSIIDEYEYEYAQLEYSQNQKSILEENETIKINEQLKIRAELNEAALALEEAIQAKSSASMIAKAQNYYDKIVEITELKNETLELKNKENLTRLEEQELIYKENLLQLKQDALTEEKEIIDYRADILINAESEITEREKTSLEKRLDEVKKSEKSRHDVVWDGIVERSKLKTQEHNQRLKDEIEYGEAFAAIKAYQRRSEYQGTKNAAGELAVLINSENDNLAAIGKAATIVQIGISTAESAMKAYAGLAWIPVVGFGLGILAAAALTAYGAEQINTVRGMKEGGIVPGVGRGDKVPAMLEPGELVVPRDITAEIMNQIGARKMADGGMATGSEENKNLYQTFADIFNPASFIRALVYEYIGIDNDAGEGTNQASGFGAEMFGGMTGGMIKNAEKGVEELADILLGQLPGGKAFKEFLKWSKLTKGQINEIMADIIGEGPLYDFLNSVDSELSDFLFTGVMDMSTGAWGAATGIADMLGDAFGNIGDVFGFQKGGIVPGSGSGDIVPAFLEPGEMVIPKDLTSSLLNISSGYSNIQIPTNNQSGGGNIEGGKVIHEVVITMNDNAAEIINAQIREGASLGYLNRN